MLWVYQKLKMLRSALCTKDTPRQMAAGVASGLLLGLLPKGNLLAAAVATGLLATRMSLATGMLCACLISLGATQADPVTHRIGEWLLTQSALVPFWRWMSRIPFAAWTSFNNTVVMGSFALGLMLMYPAYRVALPWMERLQRRYSSKADENEVADTQEFHDPDAAELSGAATVSPHQFVHHSSDQRRSCA